MRCGPMVPQIKDALYITLEPLHVKRCLFVGSQSPSMWPIIHRKTVLVSFESYIDAVDINTSCLSCCGKYTCVDLTKKEDTGRDFLETNI